MIAPHIALTKRATRVPDGLSAGAPLSRIGPLSMVSQAQHQTPVKREVPAMFSPADFFPPEEGRAA